jgi:VIT1/CCC1 family predicted Fe2+/Mn2+ transporter
MRESIRTGVSFGLTSGTITTLGLMVGLHSGTHSRLAVIGGILTIAIADAFSDALGIHVSEEAEHRHTEREIWAATVSTFASKLFFALTFIIPVFLLDLPAAIVASVVWGLLILTLISWRIAKGQGTAPWKVIAEHVGIALVVVVVTHYVGDWIRTTFG